MSIRRQGEPHSQGMGLGPSLAGPSSATAVLTDTVGLGGFLERESTNGPRGQGDLPVNH